MLRTVTQDGVTYRQVTVPWRAGVALQVARDMGEVESTLQRLLLRLVLLTLAGVAGAAALGWVLAGRIVRPVTAAAGRGGGHRGDQRPDHPAADRGAR